MLYNNMSKKLTYEYVKEQFEKEGYKLLSKEYINNNIQLECTCPKGHKYKIAWKIWQQGKRCPYCAGNSKLNIEKARAVFELEGYELLTNVYVNARTLMLYKCPKGHIHTTTLDNFKRGYRCPYCNGRPIKTINEVRRLFSEESYTLLSNKYLNVKQKLRYKCPVGHFGEICLSSWQMGNRCRVCAYIKNSGPNHPNWKGGISCEPYCDIWLDKEFKETIKARDSYKCQNPDCWGMSDKLVIHHIDYNKKNCSPENLITLCNSCNVRANKNREWHNNYYKQIINKGSSKHER